MCQIFWKMVYIYSLHLKILRCHYYLIFLDSLLAKLYFRTLNIDSGMGLKRIILNWLDSAIRRRKRACDDLTASHILVGLQCCVWLLEEIPSSRADLFGLNNCKSGVNRHLRFYQFKKNGNVLCVGAYFNSEMCRVGPMVKWIISTHTRHISDFFGNVPKSGKKYVMKILFCLIKIIMVLLDFTNEWIVIEFLFHGYHREQKFCTQ